MQKDLAPDIELNLKKKARRRLVGAIALVLLLIILLPFLLQDRSELVSNDNVEISLDNGEVPVYGELVDESLPPSDFDSSVVPEMTNKETVVALPPPVKSTEVHEVKKELVKPKPEKTPEPVKVAPKKSVPKKVEVKKAVIKKPITKKEVQKPKIDPKPTPKKEVVKQPAKAVVKEMVSNKKFYVQVGAFSDASKVNSLQAKMNELGYQSRTEKVKTQKGELIRLRSQVFSSRNEAAIALENMKDAGLTGMVVSQ